MFLNTAVKNQEKMNEIGLNIKTCDKFVALYIYVYFKALGIFNNDDG